MTHLAIEHALLAVMAARGNNMVTATDHIRHAKLQTRATARRERQVVEIAALVVAGEQSRSAGLALEHCIEFPKDRELLARITSTNV